MGYCGWFAFQTKTGGLEDKERRHTYFWHLKIHIRGKKWKYDTIFSLTNRRCQHYYCWQSIEVHRSYTSLIQTATTSHNTSCECNNCGTINSHRIKPHYVHIKENARPVSGCMDGPTLNAPWHPTYKSRRIVRRRGHCGERSNSIDCNPINNSCS